MRLTRTLAWLWISLLALMPGCRGTSGALTTSPRPSPLSSGLPVTSRSPSDSVTFTIVFDNNPHQPGLEAEWGFACLVETQDQTVLFDTGSVGAMLLRNLQALS